MAEVVTKVCNNCGRLYSKGEDFYTNTSRWRMCSYKNLWFNCSCGSTLMLKSGKYDWYNPTQGMSAAAISVFNTLPSLNMLPRLSSAVMELQQSIQVKDADIPQIAKIVRKDPFISANILNIANNLKSNRSPLDKKKIESIEHAIMYVGKKTLEELVLTVSLKAIPCSTRIFNTERFWQESFVTGDIAEALVSKFQFQVNRDELFISATLCNIGKIIAALCLPEKLDQIQYDVTNPKTQTTWQVAEKRHRTLDHCVLGEIGATIWGLPIYVSDAALEHHSRPRSELIKSTSFGIVDIVAFANQMCHWILLRPGRIDYVILDRICKSLGLDKADLQSLGESLMPIARKQIS